MSVVLVLVWWWWPAGDEFVTLKAALVFSAPVPPTYGKEQTHLEELTLCPSGAVIGCTSNLEGTPKMVAPRLGHRGTCLCMGYGVSIPLMWRIAMLSQFGLVLFKRRAA